jgi:hypothetical protein
MEIKQRSGKTESPTSTTGKEPKQFEIIKAERKRETYENL